MIKGGCLCGGVRFEVDRVVGPFELCHCNRCRKTSGSAFLAAVGARREDFRWISGQELVRTYDAPIVEAPPAYRSCFCGRCALVRDRRRSAAARQAGAHPPATGRTLSAVEGWRAAVRRYRDADEAAVVDVWHRSGRAAYTYLPTWQAFDRAQALAVFRATILARNELWVAEENGRIVGFLAMNGSYLDRLYIDPDLQRRGWGTRLLEHARSLSPRGLELHTHVENHAARALYEKHGFVAVRFGASPPPESAPDVEYHWRP